MRDDKGYNKHVTLNFLRDQLLYDIGNLGYVEGHILPDDQEHARHVTSDIIEDGNVDRITRILDLVHAEAEELLYPYTKRKTTCVDDRYDPLINRECYVIDMHVPDRFSSTTSRLLETLIHEWMVAAALADWLGITNERAAQKWKARAEEMRLSVMDVKGHHGVMTRPMHPF